MKKAAIFWFTGLSGAGKTTIANSVRPLLERDGLKIEILDGDVVRERYGKKLGFSFPDILENNRMMAEMCRDRRGHCDGIMVPIISPFPEARELARSIIGDPFYLVYFAASLKTVQRRDVKGLYQMAHEGRLDNLIGFSDKNPYYPPSSPDFTVDSSDQAETLQESIARFYEFARAKIMNANSTYARDLPI